MKHQAKILPDERVAFSGEVHSLLEQLGSSDERFSFATVLPGIETGKDSRTISGIPPHLRVRYF